MDECEQFYQRHRGGSGAVVVVIAIRDRDGQERTGIFSSIETADEWCRSLGDAVTCLFVPYIVDDPDWGNEADTKR